ncbi:MAG: hypothetical protein AAF449_16160, partial [Myxococcota bacterium]
TIDRSSPPESVPHTAAPAPLDMHDSGLPTRPPAADDGVAEARARLARLRARLDSSAQRWQATAPEATASRVRETVGTLRNRLEDGEVERRRLLEALNEAERIQADSDRARRQAEEAQVRAEALAQERAEVARAALTESEALAEERDAAVARANELQELSQQQASLLEDMENKLLRQADTLTESVAQAESLRTALDTAQIDLDAALRQVDDLGRIKQTLTAQVEALRGDLHRANQAKDALAEIQKLVDGVG